MFFVHDVILQQNVIWAACMVTSVSKVSAVYSAFCIRLAICS